jgi:hypothetical protein
MLYCAAPSEGVAARVLTISASRLSHTLRLNTFALSLKFKVMSNHRRLGERGIGHQPRFVRAARGREAAFS